MTDAANAFELSCREAGAAAPVLTGVSADGRLDGVLFELTLRQTYCNRSSQVLEVIYTFPLPQRAVLMGFASELNGERQVGTIVAKREAERQYEKGLAGGDAPVMLEALGDGLHTANIGNLKPGDELALEVRYAQLQAFEHGRLRLAIPTTIAPRYGNPQKAGLQPQQVPETSLEAEYPLSLSVTLSGALSTAVVECPTHRVMRDVVEGGQRLRLAASARLDRDVVFLVQPAEPLPSLVIQSRDGVAGAAPVVVMAAFQPPATASRERLALKLLVDCSGSMGGDSIESARAALKAVLEGLRETDCVSLTRFGSSIDQVSALSPCTAVTMARMARAVDAMDADLGGTEMEAALASIFALAAPKEASAKDVLLLTDGEIWQAETMIAAARASGHRVFAIGLGTAPAEGVLRSLAEATGGVCEFATPGEALEAAARRMLSRIRQSPWRGPRVIWGADPEWQTELPLSVFGADTVLAIAGMKTATAVDAVRLMATNAAGAEIEITRGVADAPIAGDTLSRTAAARRLVGADASQALSLGLAYQLMTAQTNCILVHERAAGDKTTDEAELHRVSSMLAAGWGATGSVMQFSRAVAPDLSMFESYQVRVSDHDIQYCRSSDDLADFDDVSADMVEQSGAAATHGVMSSAVKPPAETLAGMAVVVAEHLSHGLDVESLPALCAAHHLHAEAQLAIGQAVELGASPGVAWLLLANWTNTRSQGMSSTAMTALLQPHLRGLSAKLLVDCNLLFEHLLGGFSNDSWVPSRARRLERAASHRP
jgi:Ca-activated chloride channel family protein